MTNGTTTQSFEYNEKEQLSKVSDGTYTITYEVVRIEANSIEMIYSDKYDTLVGVDYHYGVKIGNIVYDNMTPQGMDFDA